MQTATKSARLLSAALLFAALTLHAATPKVPAGVPTPVVNVNTATVQQLTYLPHVGAKLAAAIVAARPIVSRPDMLRVKGIKAKRYAEIGPYVVVLGPTTATAKIGHAWKCSTDTECEAEAAKLSK